MGEIQNEGEVEEEIEQADGFKEGIYAMMVKIGRVLMTTAATPAMPSHGLALASASSSSSQGGSHEKLQKMATRPFNGSLTSWMSHTRQQYTRSH